MPISPLEASSWINEQVRAWNCQQHTEQEKPP
jgi:hypothetical protein